MSKTFDLVDHVADHVLEFNAFPVEHETADGDVMTYNRIINRLPQPFVKLCQEYIDLKEES